MKKEILGLRKIIFTVTFLVFIASCSKNPEANFTYSPTNPSAGEIVQFSNSSTDAKNFSWNFGDMSIGSEESPSHIYEQSGEYLVELSASRGLKSDSKTITISVD
jgi:PKD repeat protein